MRFISFYYILDYLHCPICRLERKTEELEKILTSRTTSGEMKTRYELKEIGKKVRMHRARVVHDVVSISPQFHRNYLAQSSLIKVFYFSSGR